MNDLLDACNAARRSGQDFPTIWRTILKAHRLVTGVPMQSARHPSPVLEVRPINGCKLLFDAHGFSIE